MTETNTATDDDHDHDHDHDDDDHDHDARGVMNIHDAAALPLMQRPCSS